MHPNIFSALCYCYASAIAGRVRSVTCGEAFSYERCTFRYYPVREIRQDRISVFRYKQIESESFSTWTLMYALTVNIYWSYVYMYINDTFAACCETMEIICSMAMHEKIIFCSGRHRHDRIS